MISEQCLGRKKGLLSAQPLMSGRYSCLWALLRGNYRGSWIIFYSSAQPLLLMLSSSQWDAHHDEGKQSDVLLWAEKAQISLLFWCFCPSFAGEGQVLGDKRSTFTTYPVAFPKPVSGSYKGSEISPPAPVMEQEGGKVTESSKEKPQIPIPLMICWVSPISPVCYWVGESI